VALPDEGSMQRGTPTLPPATPPKAPLPTSTPHTNGKASRGKGEVACTTPHLIGHQL
jgi:hypothetical protein